MSDKQVRESEREFLQDQQITSLQRFLIQQLRGQKLSSDQIQCAARLGFTAAKALTQNPIVDFDSHRSALEAGLSFLSVKEAIHWGYDCVERLMTITEVPFQISPGPEDAMVWVRSWIDEQDIEIDAARQFVAVSREIGRALTAQSQALSWLQDNVVLASRIQAGAESIHAVSQLVAAVCLTLENNSHEDEARSRVLDAIDGAQSMDNSDREQCWQRDQLARRVLKLKSHSSPLKSEHLN